MSEILGSAIDFGSVPGEYCYPIANLDDPAVGWLEPIWVGYSYLISNREFPISASWFSRVIVVLLGVVVVVSTQLRKALQEYGLLKLEPLQLVHNICDFLSVAHSLAPEQLLSFTCSFYQMLDS